MILLELALNGIRHFTDWVKIPFRPGFNWIRGDNGSGKTATMTAIVALLSPEDRPDLAGLLSQGDGNLSAQAALAFKGNDGKIYRVARDFKKGVVNLFILDANRKFALMQKNREPIRAFLAEMLGVGDGRTAFSLFSLGMEQMPSSLNTIRQSPAAIAPSADSPATPGRAEKEKRLAELREAAREAERLNTLEQQISDLHATAADIKRKMTTAGGLQGEIEETQQRLHALRTFEGMSANNMDVLLDGYQSARKHKEDRLDELDETSQSLRAEREKISEAPIWRNPLFLGGCAGVFLSFVGGLFINLVGIFQQVYLLALLGSIGLVVFSVVRDLHSAKRRKDHEARIAAADKETEAVGQLFESEQSRVLTMFRQTSSPDIEIFQEKFREYTLVSGDCRRLKAELEEILRGETIETLREEISALDQQTAALEAQVRQQAGMISDPYSYQDEIQQLEADLANPTSLESSLLDIPAAGPLAGSTHSWPGTRGAATLLGDRRDAVAALAMEAFRQFAPNSGITFALTPAFEPDVPSGQRLLSPSPGTLDQIALAFVLGCLKTCPRETGIPILWDDPLLRLDSRHRAIALDLLREAAKERQILFFTGIADPPRPGDSEFRLP